MITSIVFSLLLSLVAGLSPEWKPTCGAAQQQSHLNLLSTDIFVRHLNSGALNSTLTECSNFHRHICPKQGMSSATSFQGLFDEIVAIERPCTKYDVLTKIEQPVGPETLVDYHRSSDVPWLTYIFLSGASNVIIAKCDVSTFTNFVKRKAFTDSLAANLKNIINPNGGAKKMLKSYLPFLKDVTDYNHLTNVLFREGFETGVSRDRHHDAVTKVAQEYSRVLNNAAWSTVDSSGETRYDRFSDAVLDIYDNVLHSSLNNLGIGNASVTFSKDFYNFYAEERIQLLVFFLNSIIYAALVVLPALRNLIAVNRAHARVIATMNLDMLNRWSITKSAQSPTTISGFFVWICIQNQLIFDFVGQNSPDGALFGVMGYLYGHEMYHGVDRELYPAVMPTSPVVSDSKTCSRAFFIGVSQRFPGDARLGDWWDAEERSDQFGTQIAYGAFKTAIGSRIDDLAYPALNITHRQMFFYANSINGCNVHNAMSINGGAALYDSHYTVNGRLGQIPEFQTAFQCSASDNMVFAQFDLARMLSFALEFYDMLSALLKDLLEEIPILLDKMTDIKFLSMIVMILFIILAILICYCPCYNYEAEELKAEEERASYRLASVYRRAQRGRTHFDRKTFQWHGTVRSHSWMFDPYSVYDV
ncbi:hypothetical protein PRIPAC_96705 [Pristionchus pacificus]|uniref:Peptidase n=1 Tax=Pristionchus pacificus TaxID=54126 RepID=A0A2A6BJV6_PRIPA|nr:hypothetical protein PRIPAC_96705 [Pristionchus pacificus]|eukprot:PDM66118.1 Peptidase [Pristionchus pacificus]